MSKRRKKEIDNKGIIETLRRGSKPMASGEILRALKAPKKEKQHLKHLLNLLVAEGRIIRLKRGAYGLAEQMKMVTGVLEIQRSGVGFVLPDDKRRADIFISPSNFGDAWHGDRVAVVINPGRTGRRAEGRIARVLERKITTMPVCVIKRLGSYFLCHPSDPKQKLSLMVEPPESGDELEPGDVLVVRPVDRLEANLWSAEIEDVLGTESDVAVQERLVKVGHNVPTTFPKKVLYEAESMPDQPNEADFEGRTDLRHLDFVTIDGAKARDFDDAIYVEREGDNYRLWVAIADVGHYVMPHSALDKEARVRGNSYYFPQSVEPMFPEALSNGLCSLNPKVDRLVMVAEILFSDSGKVLKDGPFYAGIIHSKARLTYAQVNRALFLDDAKERENIAPQMELLQRAEKLARKLHDRRSQRGSIDFDLPEPEIQFNLMGEAVDITPRVRHFGHQIIEEFMIAANEAVARFLLAQEAPCMYRVHDEPDPDKLAALFRLLSNTELVDSLPAIPKRGKKMDAPSPLQLQQVLAASAGTDMEYLVGRLTLRTMKQAKYEPENIGHYGLASECYCHFTSPIRRYADLVVHRSLKQVLAQSGNAGMIPMPRQKGLVQLGEQLSDLERVAMKAEREILKRITILFLRERVGEEFTGVVNSLADFGFWVELKEVMAEGLVRLSTLQDDYYAYVPEHQELMGERTGKRLRLGQSVRVRLTDVNLSRLEVNLELLEDEGADEEANG